MKGIWYYYITLDNRKIHVIITKQNKRGKGKWYYYIIILDSRGNINVKMTTKERNTIYHLEDQSGHAYA